ncbi:hypothetical protein [Paenarthrobacter nicotinovorans]|uniref:hypothetical protein n=1 Tax=Paenarthrobacter nicotinovorans TaxID=29320 RepID=UPI003D679421
MNKTQRLRNVADGFMGGLVANGYRGPWGWNNLDWELSFYRAWHDWEPQQRDPQSFPRFELGGTRTSSEARELLWQLKSTSPFHAYQKEQLPLEPRGLTPSEYLEIYAEGATPEEWIALAAAFLDDMEVHSTDAAGI